MSEKTTALEMSVYIEVPLEVVEIDDALNAELEAEWAGVSAGKAQTVASMAVSGSSGDLPPAYQEVTMKPKDVPPPAYHTLGLTTQSSPQGVRNIEIRPLPAVRAIDIDTSEDVTEYRCTPCSCISSGILFGALLGAEIFCLLTHRLNPLGWLFVVCLLTYFLREPFFRIFTKKFFSLLFSRRQVPTVNHV